MAGTVKNMAPLKKRVILPALAAILVLALAVCALHIENAVSLRGTAKPEEYVQTDGRTENLVPIVEDPWTEYGVLHIRGALLRMNQQVRAVNVRVGLIPETDAQDEALLLNTQLIRRFDHAETYGCDDHCGFSAAVRLGHLTDARYQVVLVDETDGARRMIETGMTIMPLEGGLAFARACQPEEEKRDAR